MLSISVEGPNQAAWRFYLANGGSRLCSRLEVLPGERGVATYMVWVIGSNSCLSVPTGGGGGGGGGGGDVSSGTGRTWVQVLGRSQSPSLLHLLIPMCTCEVSWVIAFRAVTTLRPSQPNTPIGGSVLT